MKSHKIPYLKPEDIDPAGTWMTIIDVKEQWTSEPDDETNKGPDQEENDNTN